MASKPYDAETHFSECFLSVRTQQDLERDEQIYNSYDELTSQLPINHDWSPVSLQHYQSFWIPDGLVPACMAIQSHFNPRPSDILLVTSPKSGTTWLKALSFATLHRRSFSLSNHPLLTNTPHQCVPFFERFFSQRTIPNLNVLPSPFIFATHLPFSLLPQSALRCRVVYLCRDPKDTFVSLYHFLESWMISSTTEYKSTTTQGLDLSKAFQMFSQGTSAFGPFWDNVLGYWKESLRSPEMVLFFRYEEMMQDPVSHLRRLAEFMGCPFSMEEERDGVIEGIVKLCSFDNLREVEVNKDTKGSSEEERPPASSYFRKGKVGDWVNYLSMEMAEKLDAITKEKLHGSGLSFD